MSSKAEEIKTKIFEALATGEYDLFEVLLGLTQAQEMILQSFNTGELEETGDYQDAITPTQHQEIQRLVSKEPVPDEKSIPVEKPNPAKPNKKKAVLPLDLSGLDLGVFDKPL